MSIFEPPPTYADPVLVDEKTGKSKFNPIWLKWFIDITAVLTAAGGGSVVHNLTTGIQGGSPGQYNHLTNAQLALLVANLHNALSGLQGGTTNEYYHLTAAQINNTVWSSWTPTRTNWTDVGAPTVTARYCTIFHLTTFQIKVVPATTTAVVAGTSYISLPVACAAASIAGVAAMENLTTLVSVGLCTFDVANSRCYVPTQGATANTLVIAGSYET